jgi:superfamily II helicase
MSKINNIINGWWSYLNSNELTPKELKRAKICAECPHRKYSNTIKVLVKDEIKEIQGFICNECKCPLSAKIRSNDNCPLNKW